MSPKLWLRLFITGISGKNIKYMSSSTTKLTKNPTLNAAFSNPKLGIQKGKHARIHFVPLKAVLSLQLHPLWRKYRKNRILTFYCCCFKNLFFNIRWCLSKLSLTLAGQAVFIKLQKPVMSPPLRSDNRNGWGRQLMSTCCCSCVCYTLKYRLCQRQCRTGALVWRQVTW